MIALLLEGVLQVVPVSRPPEGYRPSGVKNLNLAWISLFDATGRGCHDAIVVCNVEAPSEPLKEWIGCWTARPLQVVSHPTRRSI